MRPSAAPVGAASAMLLVGTSTAVSATIAHYPVFTGQALRYALASAILLAVVGHQRLPRVRPYRCVRAASSRRRSRA